jgi:hypothetical protein
MSNRDWFYTLTDLEVWSALIAHIEKERGIKIPISGAGVLHFVTHREGGRFSVEIWSEPKPAPKRHKPFRLWPRKARAKDEGTSAGRPDTKSNEKQFP